MSFTIMLFSTSESLLPGLDGSFEELCAAVDDQTRRLIFQIADIYVGQSESPHSWSSLYSLLRARAHLFGIDPDDERLRVPALMTPPSWFIDSGTKQ
jgi:hypothetical protein